MQVNEAIELFTKATMDAANGGANSAIFHTKIKRFFQIYLVVYAFSMFVIHFFMQTNRCRYSQRRCEGRAPGGPSPNQETRSTKNYKIQTLNVKIEEYSNMFTFLNIRVRFEIVFLSNVQFHFPHVSVILEAVSRPRSSSTICTSSETTTDGFA